LKDIENHQGLHRKYLQKYPSCDTVPLTLAESHPRQIHIDRVFIPIKGSTEENQAGQAIFFVIQQNQHSASQKSANSWTHSAMANLQISEVCQSGNRKSANL
jgi:hypothetical protein